MAFKSIGSEGTSAERKDFIEQYLESLDRKELKRMNESYHEVEVISFGRKGITMTTGLFAVFVWKSSELYSQLREAADIWAMGNPTPSLMVHIISSQDAEYELGLDPDNMVSWDTYKKGKQLKISTLEDATESEPSQNPFIFVSPNQSK